MFFHQEMKDNTKNPFFGEKEQPLYSQDRGYKLDREEDQDIYMYCTKNQFSKDMVVELPKSIALFFLLKESSILID